MRSRSWCAPLALGALLALLLTPGGCAGRPDGETVTLVFKYSRILGKGDPVPGLLAEFEAAHPGVRVKGEALPWTSDDQHQLYVINPEGRSPGFDVMMLDCIWVPEFARAGWLVDLTSHLTPDELAPYFSSAVSAGTYDGRVWALPWNMNVGLLYYRSDLLARYGLRPPETYEELIAAVGRIRDAERNPALEGYLWQGKQYEGLVVNVLEARVALGGADALDRGDQRVPRRGRLHAVAGEQIGAVVEEADVHVPRQRPQPALPRRRPHRRGKERRELGGPDVRREIQEPARARELGHPDHVEHHHVEARAASLEVDHVELVLVVGAGG